MRPFHLSAAFVLLAATTTAEPISETCALYTTPEICACATEKLAGVLTPMDLALYAATSGEAMALQAAGTELQPAWEEATTKAAAAAGLSASSARDRLNAAGSAHRKAMKECGF